MKVFFNSEEIDLDSSELINLLKIKNLEQKTGIAVAINSDIIPRSEWETQDLNEMDKVVVITATAGG